MGGYEVFQVKIFDIAYLAGVVVVISVVNVPPVLEFVMRLSESAVLEMSLIAMSVYITLRLPSWC